MASTHSRNVAHTPGGAPIEALEARALFAGGGLDPAFAGDGTLMSQFAPGGSSLSRIAVQPDGKVLAIGRGFPGPTGTLARYNVDGTPDLTFGGGDGVADASGPGGSGGGTAIALDAAGRIFVAGLTGPGTTTSMLVRRLLPNGAADPTFGDGGFAVVDLPGGPNDAASGLVAQPDGMVLVAGFSSDGTGGGTPTIRTLLTRLRSDGTLDTGFGEGGFAHGDTAASVRVNSGTPVLQADGRILFSRFDRVTRFTAAGQPDGTFGTGGSAAVGLGYTGVAGLRADGKIDVVAVEAVDDVPIGAVRFVRLRPDGSPDASFGTGGVVRLAVDGVFDRVLAIPSPVPLPVKVPQPLTPIALGDGRFVVAGAATTTPGNTDFALARFNADGSLDRTFGTDGRITTDLDVADRVIEARFAPDGKLFVAGTAQSDHNDARTARVAIARYALGQTLATAPVAGDDVASTPAGTAVAIDVLGNDVQGTSPLDAGGVVISSQPAHGSVAVDAGTGRVSYAPDPGYTGDDAFAYTVRDAAGLASAPATVRVSVGGAPPVVGEGQPTLGVVLSGALPLAVVGGGKAKAAQAVTVTNLTAGRLAEAVGVTLFASLDQTLDAGDAQVVTVTKKLKLNAGAAKALRVKIGVFPAVADGDYYLIARASHAGGTGGIGAGTTRVTIAAPFTDLRASVQPGPSGGLAAGRKASVRLVIENVGNVAARGTVNVALYTSADAAAGGGDDVPLATVPMKVSLKPAAGKRYTLRFVVPAGLQPGTAFLVASLNEDQAFGERDLANNLAIGTSPVIIG